MFRMKARKRSFGRSRKIFRQVFPRTPYKARKKIYRYVPPVRLVCKLTEYSGPQTGFLFLLQPAQEIGSKGYGDKMGGGWGGDADKTHTIGSEKIDPHQALAFESLFCTELHGFSALRLERAGVPVQRPGMEFLTTQGIFRPMMPRPPSPNPQPYLTNRDSHRDR